MSIRALICFSYAFIFRTFHRICVKLPHVSWTCYYEGTAFYKPDFLQIPWNKHRLLIWLKKIEWLPKELSPVSLTSSLLSFLDFNLHFRPDFFLPFYRYIYSFSKYLLLSQLCVSITLFLSGCCFSSIGLIRKLRLLCNLNSNQVFSLWSNCNSWR